MRVDAETLKAPPQAVATDALLVQASLADAAALPDVLKKLAATTSGVPGLQGTQLRVHAAYSQAQKQLYAYLYFGARTSVPKDVATALESALKNTGSGLEQVRVSRLEQVFTSEGASTGTPPVFHYVVEMDPETGWMPELSQWYDTEHMPGLATVPGCIRASRFLNHDHGPLSLACYDLVTQETLGSPPWLAVRGTPWSDRMRPRFTNTIRTMFTSC